MFKLPAAYICGVRLKKLNSEHAEATVRHRWINQNPFKSMYFAVQCMAAELSTGALVMAGIRSSGASISMLITSVECSFQKKATGLITFVCEDGEAVSKAIALAVSLNQPQTLVLRSVGRNASGEIVSDMKFHWSLRTRA